MYYSRLHEFLDEVPTVKNLLAPNNPSRWDLDGIDPLGNGSGCRLNNIVLDGNFFPAEDWQPQNRITIQASNSIETPAYSVTGAWDKIMNDRCDFVFQAGSSIRIRPGFRTVFGAGNSRFVAKIAPCSTFNDCGFNFSNKIAINNPKDNTKPKPDNLFDEFLTNQQMDHPSLSNGYTPLPETPQVFPNPFLDGLTVRFAVTTPMDVSIVLMDVYSRVIWQTTKSQFVGDINEVIQTSSLAKGCYILKVNYGGKEYSKKVVKN